MSCRNTDIIYYISVIRVSKDNTVVVMQTHCCLRSYNYSFTERKTDAYHFTQPATQCTQVWCVCQNKYVDWKTSTQVIPLSIGRRQ